MKQTSPDLELEHARLNQQTATIDWVELQRFFASGYAIYVNPRLDLVAVAQAFAQDDVEQIKKWMDQQQLAKVSDLQAQQWFERDAKVWAVVVKPWVLVQNDHRQQ